MPSDGRRVSVVEVCPSVSETSVAYVNWIKTLNTETVSAAGGLEGYTPSKFRDPDRWPTFERNDPCLVIPGRSRVDCGAVCIRVGPFGMQETFYKFQHAASSELRR